MSRADGVYTHLSPSTHPPLGGCRDHNTPGSLRPWTRLHLISRIVLNHHGSRGSPRISRLSSRGRYRWPAASRASERARSLAETLSRIELLVLDARIYNSPDSRARTRRYRDDTGRTIVAGRFICIFCSRRQENCRVVSV